MSLSLDLPHHDGSALYVPTQVVAVGDLATVRLRVPRASGFTRVHVRVTPDSEARYVAAEVEREDDVDVWWVASLPVVNVTTRYRFVLEGGPRAFAWLNAAGLWARDVPDDSDFRLVAGFAPPAWVSDAVVYQVFPDRYAASPASLSARGGPWPPWAVPAAWDDPVDTSEGVCGVQLYGGDLDGVTERLDHIAALGATVLYLTPFFPAGSNHRYDAQSFDVVDPVLGGDDALRRLTQAAHARGIRVLGDVTTNHTGVTHAWFRAAAADEAAPERDYYRWHADGSPVCWYDVPTLPKLNWDSPGLRAAMLGEDGVIRRWLRAGLDGWRVDVANMTGRDGLQDVYHEVARLVRAAAVAERPDALLVAEHTHDHSKDVPGDGWHGVMNYAGVMKPLWTWLRQHGREGGFLGAPVVVPELGAELVAETIRDFSSRVPWSVLRSSFNLVGSHDATRVRTLVGEDARVVDVAAGVVMTLPGMPMLTYGDEIGMEGTFGEDGRRPMPWSEDAWDLRLLEVYRGLVAARRGSVALREGGLRWVHADGHALVYLREHEDQIALIHCARAAHAAIVLPAAALPGIGDGRTAYGPGVSIESNTVTLAASAPQVSIHVWRPA